MCSSKAVHKASVPRSRLIGYHYLYILDQVAFSKGEHSTGKLGIYYCGLTAKGIMSFLLCINVLSIYHDALN